MILFVFFLMILINLVLFKNLNLFNKILNISDIPDKRKIHTYSVPLLGGTFFFINLILIFFIGTLTKFNIFEFNFDLSEIYSICIGTIFFYFLGLLDDKKENLSATLRLILSFFILCFVMLLDQNLILSSLRISFLGVEQKDIIILPVYFNWLLTIFSFLILLNAFNMTDGINLLFTSYLLFIFFMMFFLGILNIGIIVVIPFFLIFFIKNFKSKIFFGSSGIMPAGFLVGYFFIKAYNFKILPYSDWVFVILFVPLIELLRLIVLRLRKKTHIFQADQNHLHHYIHFNFQNHKSILILLTIYFFPSLIIIFDLSTYLVFFILIAYIYLIIKFGKKIN